MTRLNGKVFTKETIKNIKNAKITAKQIANMHSRVTLKQSETEAQIIG